MYNIDLPLYILLCLICTSLKIFNNLTCERDFKASLIMVAAWQQYPIEKKYTVHLAEFRLSFQSYSSSVSHLHLKHPGVLLAHAQL